MATEKTISSAAMSFENFLTRASARALDETNANQNSATTNLSTEQNLYPRKNIVSPQRSKTWRSSDTGVKKHAAIAIDAGSSVAPRLFALVNSNLSYDVATALISSGQAENLTVSPNSATLAANQVILQGSDSSSFVSAQDFTYSLYEQDSNNAILRFYIDNDNSGSAMPAAGYRYWRVVFNKDSAESSYIELGQFWLGTVTDIAPEIGGLSSKQKDNSVISTSYSGAQYSDKITPIRTISFTIKHTEDSAEAIPLQKLAASAGATSEVIIDISAWSSDATRKSADTYYGRLSSQGFGWSAKFQRRRTIKFSFAEAK